MRAHTIAAAVAALLLAASVFAHNVGLRLLLLFLGLVFAALVAIRNRDRVRLLPPIWLPFALWAAWGAASLAWSVEPERTLKELRNEAFYTACALWVCFVAAQARDAARIFVPVLGAAALAACAIALWDFSHSRRQYMAGWHGGPGDHSSALLTLMPCAVMAGWYARRAGGASWMVFASWALAALFLVSAYATQNRTVWLGLGLQFALLGALVAMRGRVSMKLAAGILAILAASAALFLSLHASQATKDERRLALWPEIAERIAERPLTGHGFGRGLLRESLQKELRAVSRNLWHAHNIFLDAWLQTGLVGLALLALLLGAILRQAWRCARSGDDGAAACGIALIAVVAGMLARNMTDTLLARQNALLFWGVAGVLLAWGSRPWRASS